MNKMIPDDISVPCPREPHACWRRKNAEYKSGLWRGAIVGFGLGIILMATFHV